MLHSMPTSCGRKINGALGSLKGRQRVEYSLTIYWHLCPQVSWLQKPMFGIRDLCGSGMPWLLFLTLLCLGSAMPVTPGES